MSNVVIELHYFEGGGLLLAGIIRRTDFAIVSVPCFKQRQ
jgi:hypothetical protein